MPSSARQPTSPTRPRQTQPAHDSAVGAAAPTTPLRRAARATSPQGEALAVAHTAGARVSAFFLLPPAGNFSRGKESPKRAGGCGPRSHDGLRGVHPKKRHLVSSSAPPGRPVPYCLLLPGFARASRIGWPLQLQSFPQRPHELPQNWGLILHTVALQPLSHGFAVTAPLTQGSLGECKPAVLRTIFRFSP